MKVVTADEMKKIDSRSIEKYGIPGVVLMENAGRGAADVIEEFLSDEGLVTVLIIAGKGNNGGDGFVVARHLENRGFDCEVCLIGKKSDVKGDARVNLDAAEEMGIDIHEIIEEKSQLEEAIGRSDLIVDALLGTGLTKAVKGFYEDVISAINESFLPVVSLDIPSGIDSTKGIPLGTAVEADLTVTFCLPKIGTVVYPGADYAGELFVAPIGAPEALLENGELKTELIFEEDIEEILLPRSADSHKGSYGHLLVIGGSTGKSGAPAMAAEGAMRSGAGLVTVAAPSAINDILEVKLTEPMTEPIPSKNNTVLDTDSLDRLVEVMDGKDALVIGPGMSRESGTGELLRELMGRLNIPAVIDADALWHLAELKNLLKKISTPLILTPHPGEMARLIGKSSKEVQADRIGIARSFAADYGCYLVLKGAATLVATPEGAVYINQTGNPGMASGGTGDVLCGIIGSLLGQGYSPLEASLAGVCIHGLAGDEAAEKTGEYGLVATDMIEVLPRVIMNLMD